MRAIKDNYSFLKALAAVFCCTLLITQSGLLFGQEAEEKSTPSTPAADPETKADEPAKTKEPTDSNSNRRGRRSQDDDGRGFGRGRGRANVRQNRTTTMTTGVGVCAGEMSNRMTKVPRKKQRMKFRRWPRC